MRKPLLELAARNGITADQIPRLDEKVEEVESARLALQDLVVRDRCLQSLVQKWSEIGVARSNEGVEIGLDLISMGQVRWAPFQPQLRLRTSARSSASSPS